MAREALREPPAFPRWRLFSFRPPTSSKRPHHRSPEVHRASPAPRRALAGEPQPAPPSRCHPTESTSIGDGFARPSFAKVRDVPLVQCRITALTSRARVASPCPPTGAHRLRPPSLTAESDEDDARGVPLANVDEAPRALLVDVELARLEPRLASAGDRTVAVRSVVTRVGVGSIPPITPTIRFAGRRVDDRRRVSGRDGDVAQLGERRSGRPEVAGSSPAVSTTPRRTRRDAARSGDAARWASAGVASRGLRVRVPPFPPNPEVLVVPGAARRSHASVGCRRLRRPPTEATPRRSGRLRPTSPAPPSVRRPMVRRRRHQPCVAQPGRAPVSGAGGRRFESGRMDPTSCRTALVKENHAGERSPRSRCESWRQCHARRASAARHTSRVTRAAFAIPRRRARSPDGPAT